MKLGGNYTQPHFDPITEKLTFQVFVGWHLYGSYESDVEATQALLGAVSPDPGRLVAFARVEESHA